MTLKALLAVNTSQNGSDIDERSHVTHLVSLTLAGLPQPAQKCPVAMLHTPIPDKMAHSSQSSQFYSLNVQFVKVCSWVKRMQLFQASHSHSTMLWWKVSVTIHMGCYKAPTLLPSSLNCIPALVPSTHELQRHS